MSTIPYGQVMSYRNQYPDQFLAYPVTLNRDTTMITPLLKCNTILEIGAGNRKFLPEFHGTYRTMDTDESTQQDFYSIETVQGKYDGIVMREVVEHIPRELFFRYLEKIYDSLNSRGALVLSTPNPMSAQFWSDFTHISPWPIRDMCCILRSYGFENICIYRVIWPSRALWLKRLYWSIHSRMYQIDYAGAYVAIAYKPSESRVS